MTEVNEIQELNESSSQEELNKQISEKEVEEEINVTDQVRGFLKESLGTLKNTFSDIMNKFNNKKEIEK